MFISKPTFGELWGELLVQLRDSGAIVSPRGKPCREMTGVTLKLGQALNNVVVNEARNASYRFMVAEWLWIYFGHDDVATISQYNKHISQFSDDGKVFKGAYGPPVVTQWPVVIETLKKDRDSRQAIISIFGALNNRVSRDVPCTLTIQFLVRRNVLETIVCMRSSDVWLGLIYDVHNFSMLANVAACQLNVDVGSLTMHLGSSHLYDIDLARADQAIVTETKTIMSPRFTTAPPLWLDRTLQHRVSPYTQDEPWRTYAAALMAKTNVDALKEISCLG